MKITKGTSYADVLSKKRSADEILVDYAMDLREATFTRMKELGMRKSELAQKLGKKPDQLIRMLSGDANVTLQTMAELDAALDLGISLIPPRQQNNATIDASNNSAPNTSTTEAQRQENGQRP